MLLVRATRDIVAFGFERLYTAGVILFAGLAGIAVWGSKYLMPELAHSFKELLLSGIIFGIVYI